MSRDTRLYLPNYDNGEEAVRSVFNSMMQMDWRQSLIARGFGWHVDVGTFLTHIQGGGTGGGAMDIDQPECVINIPNGYTLIPLRFDINLHFTLITTDDHEEHAVIAVDQDSRVVLDGVVTYGTNATLESPRNMRTGETGCPLEVASAITTDVADPTHDYDLAHWTAAHDVQGTPATALRSTGRLLYEPEHPPFIDGPAAILVHWGGDINVNGYFNADMLVVPTALVPALA